MDLDDLRARIDGLDEKLVELLNERTRIAQEIGMRKEKSAASVYVPSREKAVLERLAMLNHGPLTEKNIRAIYREIMSASISLESDVVIAYLGPQSTYSHQAAMSRFGGSVDYLACETFADVFQAVEKGKARYGMVPIENSIEGTVTPVQDLLTQTSLKVCAELYLPVEHALVGKGALKDITRVYSNPQALAQCRKWLELNVPQADLVPVSSTGKAAEIVANEPGAAAVGSAIAAEVYGLELLGEHIQDITGNTTRFAVLSEAYGPKTEADKTSMYFGIQHKVGALLGALATFENAGINLLRIESRPSKTKQWEYYFFIDFEGHADEPIVQAALEKLIEHCTQITVLGSYPRAAEL